ncbi:MAG: DUF5320 domain-containing protein [archaeon]
MPNRDGTGPEGKGQKTGRQMGKCEGAQPVGRGMGYRRFGFRAAGFRGRNINQEEKTE